MTTTPAPGPDRTLLTIGGGLAVLVVVAAAVILLLGTRAPVQFPADTPEGVVQRYLGAFDEGDLDTAYEYFSSAVREEMSLDDFERTARDFGMYPATSSRRVLFERTEIDGDEARVHLTVEEFYGSGPFGGGEVFRSERQLSLVREGGSWRIDEALIGLEPGLFDPHMFEP